MIEFKDGKYQAMVNGKLVRRSNLKPLERMLKRSQVEAVAVPESRFSINQRFGFVESMVQMLANGEQPSIVVTGPGGLGKSYTVTDALRKSGMKDVSILDDYEVGAELPKDRKSTRLNSSH